MEAAREAFEGRVAALVERRLPDRGSLARLERLSAGASQETYRLACRGAAGEHPLALRRAAGGVEDPAFAGPGLAVEAALLRAAREAGVPAPEVLHVLEPDDDLGPGFLMEWLEGETLGARIVRDPAFEAVRPRLAARCGEILARIHAIDLEAHGLGARLERCPPEALVRRTWEGYRAFPTAQPMIDYTARWLLDHLPDAAPLTLVHGDFRNGNLMVGPGGIVAVLDWELAHVGDPMRDLGWLCTGSWRFGRSDRPVGGFGGYEELFDAYERASGTAVDPQRVRFWEVFGSFWWSVACLQMAEHHRSGHDRSVERPAIGRRSSEGQLDCVNHLIPGPVAWIEPSGEPGSEMPRAGELLDAVSEYLGGEVAEGSRGRTRFLARVAANALGIVGRELELGPALRETERAGLRRLLGEDAPLEALRWRLVHALREGSLPLDEPGLAQLLRDRVANQVTVDQPGYWGLTRTRELAEAAKE